MKSSCMCVTQEEKSVNHCKLRTHKSRVKRCQNVVHQIPLSAASHATSCCGILEKIFFSTPFFSHCKKKIKNEKYAKHGLNLTYSSERMSGAFHCCSVWNICLVPVTVLLEWFLWCSWRNVELEPPTLFFPCPSHPQLNTNGSAVSSSSDG